jgi:hypothetical protein
MTSYASVSRSGIRELSYDEIAYVVGGNNRRAPLHARKEQSFTPRVMMAKESWWGGLARRQLGVPRG